MSEQESRRRNADMLRALCEIAFARPLGSNGNPMLWLKRLEARAVAAITEQVRPYATEAEEKHE